MNKTYTVCKKTGYYYCHILPEYTILLNVGDLFPVLEEYGNLETYWILK